VALFVGDAAVAAVSKSGGGFILPENALKRPLLAGKAITQIFSRLSRIVFFFFVFCFESHRIPRNRTTNKSPREQQQQLFSVLELKM
jgi:hypothetical protein